MVRQPFESSSLAIILFILQIQTIVLRVFLLLSAILLLLVVYWRPSPCNCLLCIKCLFGRRKNKNFSFWSFTRLYLHCVFFETSAKRRFWESEFPWQDSTACVHLLFCISYSSHFSREIRDYIDEHYCLWIGHIWPVSWPSRSPDLISLKNICLGALQKKNLLTRN